MGKSTIEGKHPNKQIARSQKRCIETHLGKKAEGYVCDGDPIVISKSGTLLSPTHPIDRGPLFESKDCGAAGLQIDTNRFLDPGDGEINK